jgi:hypothetical protein
VNTEPLQALFDWQNSSPSAFVATQEPLEKIFSKRFLTAKNP